MSGFDATHPRFLRPIDVARIRRNQNRIEVQRVLQIIRNVVVGAIVIVAAVWIYRHTQSNARFAVKQIEVVGAVHSSKADLHRITSQYAGLNLFQIDIARVQSDLSSMPWVNRIDIEKKLPDTLRIRVAERQPTALALIDGELHYVDEEGIAFALLTPAVGDPDLPLISNAAREDLPRCVSLLRDLRTRDRAVYSRISEIKPIAPHGFALFDRELGAFVYATGDGLSEKWRSLYGVVRAEGIERASIEYADLRFADRIVIKPSGLGAQGSGLRKNQGGPEPRAPSPEP